MPYLKRPGAHLFYDIVGHGTTTILTTHGLTHCGAYWSRTGVSAALAEAGFRVVDLDLRGHGRSVPVEGEDPGYTLEHVAAGVRVGAAPLLLPALPLSVVHVAAGSRVRARLHLPRQPLAREHVLARKAHGAAPLLLPKGVALAASRAACHLAA